MQSTPLTFLDRFVCINARNNTLSDSILHTEHTCLGELNVRYHFGELDSNSIFTNYEWSKTHNSIKDRKNIVRLVLTDLAKYFNELSLMSSLPIECKITFFLGQYNSVGTIVTGVEFENPIYKDHSNNIAQICQPIVDHLLMFLSIMARINEKIKTSLSSWANWNF